MPETSTASQPLVRFLESSGVSLDDASSYIARAHWVGDVCFAAGAESEASAEKLKASRRVFLESAKQGLPMIGMNTAILRAAISEPGAEVDLRAPPLSIDEKKKIGQQMLESGGIAQTLKLDRSEAINLLTGADLFTQAKFADWSQADEAAKKLEATVPALGADAWVQDDGESAMDPSAIEARLADRAKALLDRFGVGGIRIPGFPGFKRVEATLDGLEVAFANMAKSMDIPEKAIGLGGGWTYIMGEEFFDCAGMCTYGVKTISMGRENGWSALAHEWFHAVDFEAAKALGLKAYTLATDEAEKPGRGEDGRINLSKWRQFRESKEHDAGSPLIKAAQDLMDKIRWVDSAPETAKRAEESNLESLERLERELFERPGRPLPLAIPQDQARSAFREVVSNVLIGAAGAEELKAWREKSMGARAESRAVWDGAILAERMIKDSAMDGKLAQSKATFMQEYSSAMEIAIAQEMKNAKWSGYIDVSCEMSARAFEASFDDLPKEVRKFMAVDEGSAIWPQGSEKGAAKEQFKHYLGEAVEAMRKSGLISEIIPENWRQKLSSEVVALPTLEEAMTSKKLRERQQRVEEPVPASPKPTA